MKVLAIPAVNLKRMLRERSNIFFVFILPVALVLLVGVQFGGGVRPILGVSASGAGEVATAVQASLADLEAVEVIEYAAEEDLVRAVERGTVHAGLFIPSDADELARGGEPVRFGFVAQPDGFGPQLRAVVGSAVARAMEPFSAASFAAAETGSPYDATLTLARRLSSEAPKIEVQRDVVGEALFPPTMGRFDLGASQQLVLFVFLTALAGSSALILTRELGVSRRMLSTPTSTRVIVVGESLGRFGVALVQGLYIVVLTLILFDVNWGDPVGALVLLVVFSAVGAGAGVLMGAVFTNAQQAGGVGVIVGLGMAALGGAMLPLELFPAAMQRIARLTPHAWALEGYAELVRRGGSLADILVELGVLLIYAVVLLSLAAWRLRVVITRP